jgi:hypothetical protein
MSTCQRNAPLFTQPHSDVPSLVASGTPGILHGMTARCVFCVLGASGKIRNIAPRLFRMLVGKTVEAIVKPPSIVPHHRGVLR